LTKKKVNICYSAPSRLRRRRGTQVHGTHQAASHIPALNLPSHSRYSFADNLLQYAPSRLLAGASPHTPRGELTDHLAGFKGPYLYYYQVATLGKLFTYMCLCHQAVQFGTDQRAVMLCSREGNRRPGVALAMHHRLQWFIHLQAQRL